MGETRTTQILTALNVSGSDGRGLPGRLVEDCARAVPVTGAGLILMTDAGPAGIVAVTDGPAGTMEDLQFSLGEGPCVDASQERHPALTPDLSRTGPRRWPGFAAGALEAGIRAVFAFPLQVGGIRLGVLDLYRDRPGMLADAELAEALSFADAATAVLLHLQAGATPGPDGLTLGPVVEDRAEVHQATGMVSVQAQVPLAQALVLLRARAYASERPVVDLARDVLDGSLRFTVEPGTGIVSTGPDRP